MRKIRLTPIILGCLVWLVSVTALVPVSDTAPLNPISAVWAASADGPNDASAPPGEKAPASPPLSIFDISEKSLDGAPALAVVFDSPLDPKIRYDGYITVTDSKGNKTPGAWVLAENKRILYFPHIEPETTYTINIFAGLPAANGSKSADPVSRSVTTRKITPMFGFAGSGSVLPSRLTDGLPIVTVNVDEVEIRFLRVDDSKVPQFLNRFVMRPGTYPYELQQMAEFAKEVYFGRFTTNAAPNTRTITHIPVEEIDRMKRPGLYLAVMNRPGSFDLPYQTTHFVISDIGLHARLYRDGLDCYASSLAGGEALPGVTVELFDPKGKLLKSVQTDENGLARFATRYRKQSVLVARANDQVSLLTLREPALDLSNFDIKGRAEQPLDAFVYSPRDLYRPGETLDFSILLRDRDGKPVPEQPVSAVLRTPDGQEAGRYTLTPQHLGYYRRTVQIPHDVKTGKWTLAVYTDPAAKIPTETYDFHIEDFLPERMKLELSTEPEYLKQSEPFKVAVQGAYLYGAPASGNRITAVLNTYRDNHPLKALPDFFFGNENESVERQRIEIADVKLDEQGLTTIETVPSPPGPAPMMSPISARITVDLYETGGRPVTRSIQRTVWPDGALIGIRPLYAGKYAESNGFAEFEVIKAAPDGALSAAEGLDVTLIREERDYFWSYDEGRGWHYEYTESPYPVHRVTIDIPEGKPVKIEVPVVYGSYRIEIADPETNLKLVHRFEAGWNWQDRMGGTARPDKVNLILDKPAYRTKETVSVKVVPPHPGFGIVTVEGDRCLWSKRLPIPEGGTVVEIPIAPEWNRHDLYVGAVVFRPAAAKEKITPTDPSAWCICLSKETTGNLPFEWTPRTRCAPDGISKST